MVLFFLAEGFEEVEALAPVDLLRRAGENVVLAGVGGKEITGAHGITVVCDRLADGVRPEEFDMVVLPGGMPGTLNLEKSAAVQNALRYAAGHDRWMAAICAAPSVLGGMGLLVGKRAVCYPGFEQKLAGAVLSNDFVCVDGRVITAKGVGVAVEFGLTLVQCLFGITKANELKATLQCKI